MRVNRQRQRGMTLWGTSFVIVVIGLIGYIGLKLFPVYMEDFTVQGVLDSVAQEQGAGAMNKTELVNAFYKHFMVDEVAHFKPEQGVFIEQKGRNKIFRIRYEAVVPLFYNISALIEFDHTREVKAVE